MPSVGSRILLAAAVVATTLLPATPSSAAAPRQIDYRSWTTSTDFRSGTSAGVGVKVGALTISTPVAKRTVAGQAYDLGRWTSPWVSPGFGAAELIPSWVATTPGRTFIRTQVRGRTAAGATTSWDTISTWAADDTYLERSSGAAQPDDGTRVAYDTWQMAKGVTSWQVRVVLFRPTGRTATPTVTMIGAVATKLPSTIPATSKPTGVAAGTVLAVPRYSQMLHSGNYPRYDGGGEAWCSPTSVSMVLGYYGALPARSTYSWVPVKHKQGFVDAAARWTYDARLAGTGNWAFNTAYAGSRTGHAYVTRLPDLRAAERLIAAGTPVVASIAFSRGQLDGAPISATAGHLLVIVGFTKTGAVVVNDPAAPTNQTVRRIYPRGQFEAAWLRKSGGLVYVIGASAP